MTYPGGKGSVYHQIINQIPPHRVYIEAFAGSAAIARRKRPAEINFLIDIDRDVIEAAQNAIDEDVEGVWRFVKSDAIDFLNAYNFKSDAFVYADPPYLASTRRQPRQIYRYELMTEAEHRRLLDCLKALPCPVMISGYDSALYRRVLHGWRTLTFQAMTRGGTTATEWLWMNYPDPTELHDYSYLGGDFRERERIKRKAARWVRRLQAMPTLEREAILDAVANLARQGEATRLPRHE